MVVCYVNPDGSHVRGCDAHQGQHPYDWERFDKENTVVTEETPRSDPAEAERAAQVRSAQQDVEIDAAEHDLKQAINRLESLRSLYDRSDGRGRHLSIAITETENALLRLTAIRQAQ